MKTFHLTYDSNFIYFPERVFNNLISKFHVEWKKYYSNEEGIKVNFSEIFLDFFFFKRIFHSKKQKHL
jgi:hypothetical protein